MTFDWLTSDPELRKEIETRFPRRLSRARAVDGAIAAESTAEAPSEALRSEISSHEAIILLVGRPVLFVRKNQLEIPTSDTWSGRLAAAANLIRGVLPAVGRIEVKNHPDFTWIGTGWVVAPDVVVTNRHVALEFAAKRGAGFVFRQNPGGREIVPRIDFREEHLEPAEEEFAIKGVLDIATEDGPDMAFLQLTAPVARTPIPLASSVSAQEDVAVIGYPASDSRRNPGPDMDRIFGSIYDVKRFAPGRVTNATADTLNHDCTTLGGNSGSVVMSLETGEAVGLHFGGSFKDRNYAVPAPVIARRLTA